MIYELQNPCIKCARHQGDEHETECGLEDVCKYYYQTYEAEPPELVVPLKKVWEDMKAVETKSLICKEQDKIKEKIKDAHDELIAMQTPDEDMPEDEILAKAEEAEADYEDEDMPEDETISSELEIKMHESETNTPEPGTRAKRDKVCKMCGNHFLGYNASKYCPKCQEKRRAELAEKQKVKTSEGETIKDCTHKDCHYRSKTSMDSCDFYMITGLLRGCGFKDCARYKPDQN